MSEAVRGLEHLTRAVSLLVYEQLDLGKLQNKEGHGALGTYITPNGWRSTIPEPVYTKDSRTGLPKLMTSVKDAQYHPYTSLL